MKNPKRVYLVVGQDGVSTAWAYGRRRSAKEEADRLNNLSVPKSRKQAKLLEFARVAARRPFVVKPFGALKRGGKS